MKPILPLAALLVLLGAGSNCYAGEVSADGMSEETATNAAESKVPEGKTITDSSCQEIAHLDDPKFRCTVTFE